MRATALSGPLILSDKPSGVVSEGNTPVSLLEPGGSSVFEDRVRRQATLGKLTGIGRKRAESKAGWSIVCAQGA